jgi:hypothetical protein
MILYLFIFPTFLSDPYELCKALLEQTFLYIYKICHIRSVPNVLLLAKVGNHLLSLGPNLLTYIHTYKACREAIVLSLALSPMCPNAIGLEAVFRVWGKEEEEEEEAP